MAATLKQTLANRLNALRSTGPTSDEGKRRSSRNAQTHGLSRVGVHPPAALAEAIADRQSLWRPDYHPSGPAQEWAFDRLVAESVRLDFCEARILAARSERATRASESWDDDQAAAIAQQAASLSKRPDLVQPILLQSKHGVLWLLERWDEVLDSRRRLDGWHPDTWTLALDLLGVPLSARDGSGPWDLHPDDPTAAPGLDLISQATASLRDRLDTVLNARDDRAQLDAALGLDADDPPAIRLLERYASDARRRFSFFNNSLRRLQSEAPVPAASSPVGPPSPRPVRSAPRPITPSSADAPMPSGPRPHVPSTSSARPDAPLTPAPMPDEARASIDPTQPSSPLSITHPATGRVLESAGFQPSPPLAGERVAEGRVRGSDDRNSPAQSAPIPIPSLAPTKPASRLPGGSLASTLRDRLNAGTPSPNRRARRAASARRS